MSMGLLNLLLNHQEKNSLPVKKKNVFVFPSGFSGCAFWRLRVPLAKLIKKGSEKLSILLHMENDLSISREDIHKAVKETDLFVMQSPGCENSAMLMDLYHREGKKVIVEYDDLSFDLSPSNPKYCDLGTKETKILDKDGKVIKEYRDQESKFDIQENINKYEAFKYCLSNADGVTTTTEYLSDKFKKYNPNVYVVPNSIDFDMWKFVERKAKKDEVRVGWFGGDSHHKDLEIFGNLFSYLQNKYENVKFVIMGPRVPFWEPIFKDINPQKIEWHNWTELHMYPLVLSCMDWDIGLCPLEDTEFNRCKSNIKYLEFASLKVPVVAQNMLPYIEGTEDGKNILFANKLDDWIKQVSLLIENQELRKIVGMEGYDFVSQNFNLDKNCRIWEQTYSNILEKEDGSTRCSGVGSRKSWGFGPR